MNKPSTVIAAVRVRPFCSRELDTEEAIPVVSMPKAGVVCLHSRRPSGTSTRQFVFDHTFWSCTRDNPKSSGDENSPTSIPYADQAKVYKALAFPLLMRTLEGYNACLFAYGMTSSGKTFSITGPPENPGIIPRLVDDLFTQIAKKQSSECDYTVEMSYFEIYNERIRDLLSDRTNQSSGLTVREHPTTGPYVEGLCRLGVRSKTDIMGWLRVGNRQRTVANTTWNDQSSRSHTVFTLFLTRRTVAKYPFGDMIENVYNSQINVVDLAGSERQVSSKPVDNRLNESCYINKSLFNLGKVISQLARNNAPKMDLIPPKTDPRGQTKRKDPLEWYTPNRWVSKKSGYVSYRDSVLTWLLRDSLGGNAMTAMLATISPSAQHLEESLATLNYAKKAQSIVNKAVINEDPQGRVIRQLIAEVNRLRQESSVRCEPGSPQAYEVARLREVLVARENEVRELSRQLAERSFGTQPASPARVSSCGTASTIVPTSPDPPRAPLVDQMTSPIITTAPCNLLSPTSHTPVRPQRIKIDKPTQSTGCGTDPVSVANQSTHAIVSVRDVSIPTQNMFFCNPSVHAQMRREIERLQTGNVEALQTIGQAELRIQDLELKNHALQSDVLYYSKLSETYRVACDTLRDSHEQSIQMINTLLQALLRRTEEWQLVTTAFMEHTVHDDGSEHPAPMETLFNGHECMPAANET